MLTVSTLSVFAYSSNVVLKDDSGSQAIWHTAITEYVVIALFRFSAAAGVGSVGVTCVNSCMGSNILGVLVTLPSGVRGEADDIGFFEIICCRDLNPVTLLIVYSPS